jgi:hypothetical protein
MSDAAMGSSEDALALGEEVRDQKDSGDWHGSRR